LTFCQVFKNIAALSPLHLKKYSIPRKMPHSATGKLVSGF